MVQGTSVNRPIQMSILSANGGQLALVPAALTFEPGPPASWVESALTTRPYCPPGHCSWLNEYHRS